MDVLSFLDGLCVAQLVRILIVELSLCSLNLMWMLAIFWTYFGIYNTLIVFMEDDVAVDSDSKNKIEPVWNIEESLILCEAYFLLT